MLISQENSLLANPAPKKGSSTGREKRTYKRAWRVFTAEKQTIELIKQHLPALAYLPVEIENYPSQLSILLEEMKNRFSSTDDLAIARSRLSKFVEAGNKEKMWLLEPPETLTKLRRDRQLRTLTWHNNARCASTLASEFESTLNNPDLFNKLNPNNLLSIAVFVAAYYGGLSHTEAVIALANTLQEKKPIQKGKIGTQELLWIDLYLPDAKIYNIKIENKPSRIKRWFIDPISLGAIRHYLQSNIPSETIIYDENNLFKQFKSTFKTLGLSLPFKSLNVLCKSGIAVTESLSDVDLSSAITETMLDRNLSVCLPEEYWHYLLNPQLKPIQPVSYKDYDHWQNTIKFSQSNKRPRPNRFIGKIERTLASCLKVKDSRGHKETPQSALQKLSSIDTKDFSLATECLLSWYTYLLRDKHLKVNSVHRYHTEIAKEWLMSDEELSFSEMDSEGFQAIYTTIINFKKSTTGRHYRAKRLEALHQFASTRFGFPTLLEPLSLGLKSKPMVRAGYISKQLFDATLYNISQITDLDSNSKLCIQVMVVVAYRTGLRLNELIKLRLSEIEYSQQCWLFIRSNPFGDNKRDASLRKIPLRSLLTDTEYSIFERYISLRQAFSTSRKELFFCQDGLPTTPWDGQLISRLIRDLLRNQSGINSLVFHHFRHTALSNLQLIAEREWVIAEILTGYHFNQIETVFSAIIGNKHEQLRVYWALACFAGHNSPQTTFQSYFHFSSLIAYLKLSKGTKAFNITQSKSLTNVSSNKLSRIINASHTTADALPVHQLIDTLTIDIKKWISTDPATTKQADIPATNFDELPIRASATHSVAYKVLSEYQEGYSIPDLVFRFNVSEETIDQWVRNAKNIANLRTRENKSRVISPTRAANNIATILPAPLKSDVEMGDADSIIKVLRKSYTIERKNICVATKYYLNNTNASSSGIHVTSKKELRSFIKVLGAAIPTQRWLLVVTLNKHKSEEQCLRYWMTDNKLDIFLESHSQKKLKTKGSRSAHLYLKHPNLSPILSRNEKYKKYSAATLRYVMGMIGIMTFTDKDLDV